LGLFGSFKAVLPNRIREVLWRARAIPLRSLIRMMFTIRITDWELVLKLMFPNVSQQDSERSEIFLYMWRDPEPLILRKGSSDIAVFEQVFLQGQYSNLPVRNVQTIVDAGANVGLTSRYFLRHYRPAKLIVIEPDKENFAYAARNLNCNGDRCELLPVALWGCRAPLCVKRGVFGDGREWASQVVEDELQTKDRVEGITLNDIIEQFGLHTIDILKIDIEGAERNVFSCDTSFLKNVRCCVIELHGRECSEAFHRSLHPYHFDVYRQGEVTVAVRTGSSKAH
jgi:FkbM family methyltransferase